MVGVSDMVAVRERDVAGMGRDVSSRAADVFGDELGDWKRLAFLMIR